MNKIYKICTASERRVAERSRVARRRDVPASLRAPLDVQAVRRVDALPLDDTGGHAFPRS